MKRHPVYITAGPVMLLIAALFLLTGAVQSGPSGSDAPVTRQDIALAPGWNLISSHLTPSNPDLAAIFATTADKVVLVKDGEGNIYSPEYGINTIGNWDTRESYMVFVTAPTVLQIEGTPAPADQPITLKPGWNLLSYLLSTPSPVKEAFKSLGDALVILKDNSGRTYLPEYDIDTIGELVPGQGYSAFVSRPADLVYAEQSADRPVFKYNPECLAQPNHVLVEDFGTLTPGIAADSTQRAANTSAINAAIAAAPSPGVVCLPADSLYLTLDRVPTSYSSEGIILIGRGDITIMGAGACGWGELSGCTYLGTPGDQYYYRGPVNNDGKDHLVRGFGIKLVKSSGVNTLPNITLKGFELDGQSGWTGNYNFNYDWLYSVHWSGWDMGHKGIGIGSLADNLLVEDVKVHRYKGEIIYGNEPGSVTFRRVWSFDSNGSAYNVSSAQTTLVEDSKFGPDVRFWTEVLAEHKTDLRATFRNNIYEGCKITNGCIAIAADNKDQAREGQIWTWENNKFSCTESGQRAFYLKSGKYTGVIKDNTIDGCQLFITGNGGYTTNLQITGNTGRNGTMLFQSGNFAGIVSGNSFLGGNIYSVSSNPNLGGLVIENNTYDGSWSPSIAGSFTTGVLPLVRNNTYLNFNYGKSDFYHLPHTGCPSYDYADFRVWSTPDHISLCTLNADGQRVFLKGKGTLPASSPQHGWTSDLKLSQEPIEVVFDGKTKMWRLVEK